MAKKLPKSVPKAPIQGPEDGADHWCTPEHILRWIRYVFGGVIHIDPCSNPYSTVGAEVALTGPWGTGDGLLYAWRGNIYCNPPYSSIGAWCNKAAFALEASTLMLVPPSPDTDYWHGLVWPRATHIAWLKGRVAFLANGRPVKGNPKGSVVIAWLRTAEEAARFHEVFGPEGHIPSFVTDLRKPPHGVVPGEPSAAEKLSVLLRKRKAA